MDRHGGDDRAAIVELIKQHTNSCGYYQLLGMEIVELGGGRSRIRLQRPEK